MTQPSLFDGATLKAAGMDTARQAAPTWTDLAHQAIRRLAAQPATFTSEDVIALVGLPRPAEGANRNNAVGAVMSGACRAGLIYKTGDYTETRRPTSHARIVAVWKGTHHG